MWVKPRNPGPCDPASSTHSTTLAKAEERPGRNRGAPGPSSALLELPRLRGGARPPPAAALRSARPSPRPGSPSARCTGATGCTSGVRRSRAPPPPPRAGPRGSPHPPGERGTPSAWGTGGRRALEPPTRPRRPSARPRAQCGLPFPAARASPGPGNKAGSARRRPPGRAADTHRELGRPPAGRARGCRARRGWAQGTGLGCSAAAAGRKCGSETGREGRGAETAACAPPGPPPWMCVTSELGRGTTDGSRSPGGWRGAGSWARPVRGLNK